MLIHELTKSSGRTRKAKRLGRGNSSGKGNYSGKGLKGQKARKSGGVRIGFEGGQTPLYMRLPKLRGFKRHPKLVGETTTIDVTRFEADTRISSGMTLGKEELMQLGYVSSTKERVKVLGNGALSKSLVLVGIDGISAAAEKAVQQAGGSVQVAGK